MVSAHHRGLGDRHELCYLRFLYPGQHLMQLCAKVAGLAGECQMNQGLARGAKDRFTSLQKLLGWDVRCSHSTRAAQAQHPRIVGGQVKRLPNAWIGEEPKCLASMVRFATVLMNCRHWLSWPFRLGSGCGPGLQVALCIKAAKAPVANPHTDPQCFHRTPCETSKLFLQNLNSCLKACKARHMSYKGLGFCVYVFPLSNSLPPPLCVRHSRSPCCGNRGISARRVFWEKNLRGILGIPTGL